MRTRSAEFRSRLLAVLATALCFALLVLAFGRVRYDGTDNDALSSCASIAATAAQEARLEIRDILSLRSAMEKTAEDQLMALRWMLRSCTREEWGTLALTLDEEVYPVLALQTGEEILPLRGEWPWALSGELLPAGAQRARQENGCVFFRASPDLDPPDALTAEGYWAVCAIDGEADTRLLAGCAVRSEEKELENWARRFIRLYNLPDGKGLLILEPAAAAEGAGGECRVVCFSRGETARTGGLLTLPAEGSGTAVMDGTEYLYATGRAEKFLFLCRVRPQGTGRAVRSSTFLTAGCFAAALFLLLLYARFLRRDAETGHFSSQTRMLLGRPINAVLFFHLRRMTAVFLIALTALTFVVQYFSTVDNTRQAAVRALEEDRNYRELKSGSRTAGYAEGLNDSMEGMLYNAAETARVFFNLHPEAVREDLPADLGQQLLVLDRQGRVEASNLADYDMSGIQSPENSLYRLQDVLDSLTRRVSIPFTLGGDPLLCTAVTRGKSQGLVAVVTEPVRETDGAAAAADLGTRLFFTVSETSFQILSWPGDDQRYIGAGVESLGLNPATLTDGYCGGISLGRERYLLAASRQNGEISCLAVPSDPLRAEYLRSGALMSLIGCALILVFLAALYRAQAAWWSSIPQDTEAIRALRNAAHGRGRAPDPGDPEDLPPEDRRGWPGRLRLTLDGMNAEQRLGTVLRSCMVTLFCLLWAVYTFGGTFMNESLDYILSGKWDHGLNLYALCYAVVSFLSIVTVTRLVRLVVPILGRNFGARGETIARMLGSFIKYASKIGALIYSLVYVGVDYTATLASVGIIGLGVSLGAKDIVTDILAGVFLVFEGEFHTGDIVTIGGFTGQVEEIGIRTTRVRSEDGQTKIFLNRDVNGVISMSRGRTLAEIRVEIARQESLERVERLFREELPQIRRRIPEAEGRITLKGISETNGFCYVLLLSVPCRGAARSRVCRALYREVELLMQRENIKPR